MNQKKDMNYHKKIKYAADQDLYEVQIKKRRNWWWLLLCLIPLLLLIRCKHDIQVVTVDTEYGVPLSDVQVGINYTAHFLYKDSRLFANESIIMEQTTDSVGVAFFRDLPCSVYSYIFYCLSQAKFSASSECITSYEKKQNFHFSHQVTMDLAARTVDIYIQTKDLETGEPIPGATVTYIYSDMGTLRTDSVETEADGCIKIPNFRYCGVVKNLCGSCYGYADTCKADLPIGELITLNDVSTLHLRPIKANFSFFVKNVETKEPIPGAKATITLTHPNSKVTESTSTTNVDGKGRGFYDNAFILSKVSIKASKPHFNDSTLTGSYTVEQFCKLPDDDRTVWLRPDPFSVDFQNVDSLTRKPIAGVKNTITVTDPSGNIKIYHEVSNRNGKFPVSAKENSKITIVSEKSPEFITKTTHISAFRQAEIIRMVPDLFSLTFRTIEKESGELLPNCNLSISASLSGVHLPTNSGVGEFIVNGLRHGDRISIVASKTNYTTNRDKVNNASADELLTADQSQRDIPLSIDLPPCDGGNKFDKVKAGIENVIRSYNMGQRRGTFVLEIDAYSITDHFKVYDGPDTSCPVLFDSDVTNKQTVTLTFSQSIVTIEATTVDENSSWNYIPHCPN